MGKSPPPNVLDVHTTESATPPVGTVRKRVEDIEKSRGTILKQLPSMYVLVAMPLVEKRTGKHAFVSTFVT
jgi:hypothetical protein